MSTLLHTTCGTPSRLGQPKTHTQYLATRSHIHKIVPLDIQPPVTGQTAKRRTPKSFHIENQIFLSQAKPGLAPPPFPPSTDKPFYGLLCRIPNKNRERREAKSKEKAVLYEMKRLTFPTPDFSVSWSGKRC